MKYTNEMNLPASMVSAIINDTYSMGTADISVTSLIQPPKIRQLTSRHREEIVEDVADRVWALLGTNTHAIIDRIKHPDSLQEERLSLTVDGWRISGQADLYEDRVISDWKVTSAYAVLNGVKPEWESQLQIYSECFRHAGFKVDGLQIIAILRDWSKFKVGGNYPKKQVVTLKIPMWPREKTMAYIKGRVALHKAATGLPDDEIPICLPEERWHEPDKWAVVKGKNKKATRVLESEEEAEKIKAGLEESTGNKYRIDFREGSDKRCLHYCPCAEFCNHYKTLVPF